MRRAYDIRTSVLGEKHPDSVVTKSELASVISHRGRYDEAKEMLLECLDDIVAICGKDNPKTDKVFRTMFLLLLRKEFTTWNYILVHGKLKLKRFLPTGTFGSAYSMLSKVFV